MVSSHIFTLNFSLERSADWLLCRCALECETMLVRTANQSRPKQCLFSWNSLEEDKTLPLSKCVGLDSPVIINLSSCQFRRQGNPSCKRQFSGRSTFMATSASKHRSPIFSRNMQRRINHLHVYLINDQVCIQLTVSFTEKCDKYHSFKHTTAVRASLSPDPWVSNLPTAQKLKTRPLPRHVVCYKVPCW